MGTQQTHWREVPNDDEALWKKDLEIVPIEHAELHNLNPDLLRPGHLSEIWQNNVPTTIGAIRGFLLEMRHRNLNQTRFYLMQSYLQFRTVY